MKKLLCIALVLLAGCIRATDDARQLSKENVALARTAHANVCADDKKFTAPCVNKAEELDTELAKEGIDIEQAAHVVSEVAPVVASLPFPWAPVVGGGLLTLTTLALALARGLSKKKST